MRTGERKMPGEFANERGMFRQEVTRGTTVMPVRPYGLFVETSKTQRNPYFAIRRAAKSQ
jgi:hypothetical protein